MEELKFIALGLFAADAGIRIGRNVGHAAPSKGTLVAESDPDLDREDASSALADHLGRTPTQAELDRFLDTGEYPTGEEGGAPPAGL